MSDITKVCLLILDYNKGDLNAYQLVTLAGEIIERCPEDTICTILGLSQYRGTREELEKEYEELKKATS